LLLPLLPLNAKNSATATRKMLNEFFCSTWVYVLFFSVLLFFSISLVSQANKINKWVKS